MQMTESAKLCRISKVLSKNLLLLEPVNPLMGPVCLQDTDSEIRAQQTPFAMHMRALRPGIPTAGISCVKRQGARRTQDGLQRGCSNHPDPGLKIPLPTNNHPEKVTIKYLALDKILKVRV